MRQRITCLLGFILTLLTFDAVHGQEGKTITLPESQLTGLKIITAIKEQAGMRFNYTESLHTKLTAPVKAEKRQVTVKEALDLIKKTIGLNYEIDNEYITLSQSVPSSPNGNAGQEQGSGTLKGRIVEFETSQPLPGASVRIPALNKGMSSNEKGYYQLDGIPAGEHTLEVSFVSYRTETIRITVRAASESTYDVRLQGDNTLGEVVINAIGKTRRPVAHTSERQLVSEIKNLNVVASGISSEQISKSADRNAAQAVQRVAGVSIVDDKFVILRGLNPRYNLTYLNDNVAPSTEVNNRNFALDLLPSRIIDKILVYKSPSPENQADATGGVIKIYTKDAKTVKHFDVEFQLGHRPGTSFNTDFLAYNGGKFDFLGLDDGTRKLPSVLPGYGSLLLADLKPSEYANAFNSTLYYGKKTALPNMQVTANYYDAFRVLDRTLSSLTSFSYKNDNQKYDQYRQEGVRWRSVGSTDRTSTDDRNTNTAQLNLLQNFTFALNERHRYFFKNFLLQQGLDATIVRVSQPTFLQGLIEADRDKDITLSYSQRFLYAGNLGGDHTFNKDMHRLSWNAGYTYSEQETPDQRVIRFRGIMPEYAMGDAEIQWRARGYSPSSTEDLNTTPLSLGIISRLWSRNNEGIHNGAVDYAYKAAPWATVKIGTFQQWKKRTLSRRIYTVHEGNVDPARFNSDAIDGNHWVDANLIRFPESQLPGVWSNNYLNDDYTGLYVADRTTGSDMYVGTEQNNAGYLAVTLTPYPWIEVHGGVRYEYNRQKIGAAIPSENRVSIPVSQPILTDHIDSEWLPSVNIAYKPSDQWVIRAAYGKTVNRTEFREVSPFRELDLENNTQLSGNPDLVSAKAENVDLRLEFYPDTDNGDAISVGAFYKEITDPIERTNNSNRVVGMFPSISFSNASLATLRGVEVEVRKTLDFIPLDFFRNLSVIANGSVIESTVKYEDLTPTSVFIAERPLQGQAPYLLNAGLYYDNAGWGTRIAAIYNYVAENIYAVGLDDRSNPLIIGSENRSSLIELPRQLLDFSATQRIGDGLQLKFTVQNLLDQRIEMAEDWNRSNNYEPLVELPLVPGERQEYEGDNIASSYRPGRYFNLSLSYSF